jgi:sec-independent protein translocase protein TatA
MPFGFRLGDLIIYFVLALLIFGPKKLPEIGAAIGKTISSFKHGIKEATDGLEVDKTASLIEQRNLEIKRLELQNLERAIASKKAILSTYAYKASPIVEGTSKHADTEIQANYTSCEH